MGLTHPYESYLNKTTFALLLYTKRTICVIIILIERGWMSINNKEIKAMGLTPIPEHIYTDKTLINIGFTLPAKLTQGYIDAKDLIRQSNYSYTTSIKVLVEAEGLVDSYSLTKDMGDQYIDFDLSEETEKDKHLIGIALSDMIIDSYNELKK